MVCSSVLARYLPRSNVAAAVRSVVDNGVDTADANIKQNWIVYGHYRYTKAAEIYYSLCSRDAAKKQKYRYRIKPQCIVSCIQYLQAKLPVVAGKTRDVKVEGHILKDLSILSRGRVTLCRIYAMTTKGHTNVVFG